MDNLRERGENNIAKGDELLLSTDKIARRFKKILWTGWGLLLLNTMSFLIQLLVSNWYMAAFVGVVTVVLVWSIIKVFKTFADLVEMIGAIKLGNITTKAILSYIAEQPK